MVAKHIQRIRLVPGCADSLVVLIPENNLAFEAEHVAEAIQEKLGQGYVVMNEDDMRVGIKTDNLAKRSMVASFCDELVLGRVRFHVQFFTLTTTSGRLIEPIEKDLSEVRGALRLVYAEDTDDMRDYLINNLANFKRITKPPKDEFSEPRVFYTGKDSGEDDVTMCTIIGNSKPKNFLTNERYRPFWRHVPITVEPGR